MMWAMKKKADGTYRARLTARVYEQIDGLHFDSSDTSVPVVNDITIRIVFMAGWTAMLIDVKGAFMNGRFKDEACDAIPIMSRLREMIKMGLPVVT
jgi:hypothetical protein